MRLHKKSMSKVNLVDLLRRRKSDLTKFLTETGIVAYDTLKNHCNTMGVNPPSIEEFVAASGNPYPTPIVNSPAEGVVVLEPLPEDPVKFAEAVSVFTESDENTAETSQEKLKKQKRKKADEPSF